jgi:hypothetical protein
MQNTDQQLVMKAIEVAGRAHCCGGHRGTDFALRRFSQVLAEFHPNMKEAPANVRGQSETFLLSELLPRSSAGILERR